MKTEKLIRKKQYQSNTKDKMKGKNFKWKNIFSILNYPGVFLLIYV